MASPGFTSSALAEPLASNTALASLPASIAAGEALVCYVASTGSPSGYTINQGYTEVSGAFLGGTGVSSTVFVKTATASESAPTVTATGGANHDWCVVVNRVGAGSTSVSTPVNTPSTTTGTFTNGSISEDATVLRFVSFAGLTGITTPPSGTADVANATSNNSLSTGSWYEDVAVSGSPPDTVTGGTVTTSASGENITHLILIQEVVAGTSSSVLKGPLAGPLGGHI